MTVTNTSLLGLALPTTGTESGVWGDDVNNGLTILIDVSVAGTNNITQDSDITLAVSNGNNSSSFTSTATNSAVAQYYVLNCSGARTALRNIIVPTTSKTYVVTNGTTGGFGITVKKSGGTGVTVAAGETAIVFYNTVTGDVAKVTSTVNVSSFSAGTTGFTPSTATTGAVTLAGTLATTNGGTGLTSFTSGGVVYASSTSALATGSALTFDGSNLGVGVTPSAWSTVTALQIKNASVYGYSTSEAGVNQNAYYGSGNWRYISAVAATAYRQISGAHSWHISSGTPVADGTISFTQAMTLDASGNLGVGTTSPSFASGGGLAIYNASVPRLKFTNSTTGDASTDGTQLLVSGSDFYIQQREAASVFISTNGTNAVTVDASQNVGVGVTPSAWGTGGAVEVGFVGSSIFGRAANTTDYTQGVYYNAGFKYAQATYAVSLYEQQSGAHYWLIAGSGSVGSAVSFTQAMTLTAGSTLLVGYTSGNEVTKIETPSISIGQTGTTSTTAKIRFAPAQAGYNVMGIYNSQSASGGGLVFVTGDSTTNSSNAALMTLDASGNLLVGTTSQPGAGLSTTGNEFISAGGFISCRNSAAGYTGYVTNTSGAGLIQFFANTTAVGSISTSGGVTLYNTTSDQRLKTNIVDAPEFGSIIDSIQVRSYDWKNNQIHQRAGFIAQELVTVAPEAVHQPADTEEMMAVDYSKLVPMLVKEIQSLRKRILTLENK